MKTGGGKAEVTPQTQTFVDVTESTAHVNYIASAVQRKWGSQYVLVTSDGLQIEDGSGTQGMNSNTVNLLAYIIYAWYFLCQIATLYHHHNYCVL